MTLPHVSDRGAGPAVVVLHGTPFAPELLEAWTDAWTGAFRVLVVHRPGYGASRALQASDLAEATELVERALVDRGVNEAHFIGASSGAYLSVALTRRGRVRARSLVAIGGFVDLTEAHRAGLRGLAAALRADPGFDLEALLRDAHLAPASRAAHPSYASAVAAACSREFLANDLDAFAGAPSLLDALADLRVPGLSVRGTMDVSVPKECGEAFARACTPGVHEEHAGLGHALMMEDGPGTRARIAEWLAPHK